MNIWNLWKSRNASIWDHQNEGIAEIIHRGDCTQFGTINLQKIFRGYWISTEWRNARQVEEQHSSLQQTHWDRLSWKLPPNSFV